MEQIQQIINTEMNQLNQVIRRDLESGVPLINTVGEYIISAGGKRIRPLLTILCAKALENSDHLIYKMAAMIEYIHTATLLHDDVVDESGLRRGRPTANAVFGNAASVLVGDFIYTRAFQMMVESESLRVLKIMADATNVISEGEVLQLLNIGRSDLTSQEYFAVIESKTAKLFEAAARVAAIISGADKIQEDALAFYSIYLGTAFQIVDDILDYSSSSEVMGKNVGDDLLEGKVTLPLLYLLHGDNNEYRRLICQAIEQPKDASIERVIEVVKTSGALEYCANIAKDYVAKAQAELQKISQNQYVTILNELALKSIERIS
jgi:octaprenyl-diphosphate synthase